VIFDPFMGTGSYLAAVLKLGRRIIGIDYNEEKYNITKETYFRKWNSISSSNTSTPTERYRKFICYNEQIVPTLNFTRRLSLDLIRFRLGFVDARIRHFVIFSWNKMRKMESKIDFYLMLLQVLL
jgi:hypothetical protein